MSSLETFAGLFDSNAAKLGIFWIDPEDSIVFGVESVDAGYLYKNNKDTIQRSHKNYWLKQHRKDVAKENTESLFYDDESYDKIPRGRVFIEDDEYIVYVTLAGHDVDEDMLRTQIEDEFNLDEFEIKYISPWNEDDIRKYKL